MENAEIQNIMLLTQSSVLHTRFSHPYKVIKNETIIYRLHMMGGSRNNTYVLARNRKDIQMKQCAEKKRANQIVVYRLNIANTRSLFNSNNFNSYIYFI
jgi:hypothetical protein